MKQGDVYWCSLAQPGKRRPAVILTRTSALRYLTNVTIAPITRTVRGIPTEVILTPDDGLAGTCAVNLDNILTIRKAQLGAYIAHLNADRMRALCEAIAFALGFDEVGRE